MINKDEVKGKAKEVAGAAKRKTGEWTGNEKVEAEGAGKEVAGKVQKNWGKAKDAVEDAVDDVKSKSRKTA